MSLVGPRPNVERETKLYTSEERLLLEVRPGITDIASIVFSDEGDILKGHDDPDLAYHQLVRPGKSRLGLFYLQNRGLFMDMALIGLTAVAVINKAMALTLLVRVLSFFKAPPCLIKLASRKEKLVPAPPPGAEKIVTSRSGAV